MDRPFRQAAHVAVYTGLTILLAWALAERRPPSPTLSVACALLALLYGVTDDWHLTMVPTKVRRPQDLVWDTSGAALAVG